LGSRAVVTDYDYGLVKRVGMDCIPAVRRKLLEYLWTCDEARIPRIPASTRSYAEEELEALGLLSGRGDSAALSIGVLKLMARADLL
jgi:hypothetical protein